MALRSQQEMVKDISISIDEMLKSVPQTLPKPCISRVPNYLRQVNEEAYEPYVIAIGPYHSGNQDHLKAMEDQKIWFLRKLLEEKEAIDASGYFLKMKSLEERARKYYAEPISLAPDNFVKMLLLDGCFIVQLIRFLNKLSLQEYFMDLTNCYTSSFKNALYHDLLLLENQLPFFVLLELFNMIEGVDAQDKFVEALFYFCSQSMPGKACSRDVCKPIKLLEIRHLLDFTYHYVCHPSSLEIIKPISEEKKNAKWSFIRGATELREAGIKFKMIEGKSMFDIRFENGTLYIPQLGIDDHTEPFLRNLIAFEQLFLTDKDVKRVTDFTMFMDYLIDSPKDVETLCQKKIILNMLGDDRAVASMINSLGVFTVFSDDFYYSQVFSEINQHCNKMWNKRMANLKHNYFNSPWAFISFLAAALLLLFTVLQTVFSVLSYA